MSTIFRTHTHSCPKWNVFIDSQRTIYLLCARPIIIRLFIDIYFRKFHGCHRCGNAEATKYHTHINLGYLPFACAHHRGSIPDDEIYSRFVCFEPPTHDRFFFVLNVYLYLSSISYLFIRPLQYPTHRKTIYLDISKNVVISSRMHWPMEKRFWFTGGHWHLEWCSSVSI